MSPSMSRSYCLCFELVEDLLSSCLQACSAAGQSIMDVWVPGGRWVARMYRLQVNFWDFLCFQHAPLPCLLVLPLTPTSPSCSHVPPESLPLLPPAQPPAVCAAGLLLPQSLRCHTWAGSGEKRGGGAGESRGGGAGERRGGGAGERRGGQAAR